MRGITPQDRIEAQELDLDEMDIDLDLQRNFVNLGVAFVNMVPANGPEFAGKFRTAMGKLGVEMSRRPS